MSARGTWNTAQGIRNSSYYLNLESSTWNPEPMAWNPEFNTVLDFLACSDNSVLGAPNDFFFSLHTVRAANITLKFLTFEKSYQFLDISMCFHIIFITKIFKKSLSFTYKANGKHQIQVENFSR